MVKKKGSKNTPSHRDLVKSVSKQLKYYFELKRQEDGFDLSGPEHPRPDYPNLKTRPMLLYEGLHDRDVKHFFSKHDVKQQITHLPAHTASKAESKHIKAVMNKVMDKTTYVTAPTLDSLEIYYEKSKPPWAGNGRYDGKIYKKNSEKYLTGALSEWAVKQTTRKRGFGNPEPTLKRAFKESRDAKPRVLRACLPGYIDRRECNRLINDASRILSTSELRESLLRQQSSLRSSQASSSVTESMRSSSVNQRYRTRSASPQLSKEGRSQSKSSSGTKRRQTGRLIQRPQSAKNVVNPVSSSNSKKSSQPSSRRRYRRDNSPPSSYSQRMSRDKHHVSDNESRDRRSGSDNESRDRHSGSDDESRDRHSGSDYESRDRHSGSDDASRDRLSGSDDESRGRKNGSDHESRSRQSDSDNESPRNREDDESSIQHDDESKPHGQNNSITEFESEIIESYSKEDSRKLQTKQTKAPSEKKKIISSDVMTYHDAKDDVVQKYERNKTKENLKKGRIYYDIDGRVNPVPYKVKNKEAYLNKDGERAAGQSDDELDDGETADWLSQDKQSGHNGNAARRQDVEEKKMPYNNKVRPVEVPEPDTARSEDITRREGVRKRPKSAKRIKSSVTRSSSRGRDVNSDVTLSDGSYEQVKIDDEYSSDDYETFVEDRGCQTGWELFVNYDQSENILSDMSIEPTKYNVTVRTGSCVGASTRAPISLILYGNRGRSPELALNSCLNHKIPFQQGADDTFTVTCSYVGNLIKIMIGHDVDSGVGDGWYLNSVAVQDPVKEEIHEFVCEKWLSVRADDKMTRRMLPVTASRKLIDEGPINDDEEDEDETQTARPVEETTPQESFKHTSESKRTSNSEVSTSHLNNMTGSMTESKDKSSLISLDDQSQTSSINDVTEAQRRANRQDAFFRAQVQGSRDTKLPENIEDFESDVARHSNRPSRSSRHSESTFTDTECQTAVFEPSIASNDLDKQSSQVDLAAERLEAFKAGQRAERERQKLQVAEEQQREISIDDDVLRGPTIHQAARDGNIARVKQLLDHDSEQKSFVDDEGNTPLHLASHHGHIDLVRYLAALNSDLSSKNHTGYEPIHLCALYGHVNCLNVLVAMGASINSHTDDSKTPLHLAAMGNNTETCKSLISNRCSLKAEDDFGRTAVDMADNYGHLTLASILRELANEMDAGSNSQSSLRQFLLQNSENERPWQDDKNERPIVHHDGEMSDDESSLVDLRKDIRRKEEMEAKQKAYEDMQKELKESNMTYLDRIRYEVDNG